MPVKKQKEMRSGGWRRLWLLILVPLLMQNVCGKHDDLVLEPDQYITWQLNGSSGLFTERKDSLNFSRVNNSTLLSAISKPVANTSIEISFDSPQQSGNYSTSNFAARINGKYYSQSSPISLFIKNYGSVGNYLEGNYSGNVKDTVTSLLTPISGEFRIRVK